MLQGRNQNTSEEVELEKKSKRSASDGLVSSSSSMDGAYSNIYNVLQQNYGQRRNSYPFDDMDTKKVCNKYNSLEKCFYGVRRTITYSGQNPDIRCFVKMKIIEFFFMYF